MTPAEIRSWCLQQPRPSTLRVKSGKEVNDIPIVAGVPWSQYAKTVFALAPDTLQALDDKGNLLRVINPDDDDDDEPAAAAPATAAAANAAIVVDPETARFQLFATLIAEAYRHSNDVAFNKLVEIANIMGKRGESLERSLSTLERQLHRQMLDNVEIQAEAAEQAAANPLNELINTVASGFAGGQSARAEAAAAPAAKPNGKHTNGKG